MVTLVAVVVGGILAMLAQIVLDGLRTRAEKAARRDEIRAAVRAIRFHFYAAQHVLKAALESGLWWSGAAGLDLAAAGESLPTLAPAARAPVARLHCRLASPARLPPALRRLRAWTTGGRPARAGR